MDFKTRHELNKLSGEILSKDRELEAGKVAFARLLNGSFGENMIDTLNNPPKRSALRGLILKLQRWITIQKCKAEAKKIHKQHEQQQIYNDFENDFYE